MSNCYIKTDFETTWESKFILYYFAFASDVEVVDTGLVLRSPGSILYSESIFSIKVKKL